jgi:hypothetical protein
VPTFHYNGYTIGLQNILNCICDLMGKTFLNLEAARIHINDPRYL